VLARLKPDVTIEQAQAETETIARRLAQEYPKTNQGFGTRLVSLREHEAGKLRPFLLLLTWAVACVLLIACANVANLLLVRAGGRSKEMAIRLALGATRGRLVKQLLTESMLLAALGGGLGLALAFWGVEALVASIPVELPFWMQITVDGQTLGFTLALTLLTGLLFGLAPAFQAARPDLNEALKEGGKGTSAGTQRSRLRHLLVISEIALSLVLLIGAGLLIKSFLRLQQDHPGFQPDNLLTAHISMAADKYPKDMPRQQRVASSAALYQRITERIKALPGVKEAGYANVLPLEGIASRYRKQLTVEGQSTTEQERNPDAGVAMASADYFRTLGIPLLQGRFFNERDTTDAPPVAIVNQSLARRCWPNEDPLGKRLKIGKADSKNPWLVVAGVVGDVRYNRLESEAGFQLYLPTTQNEPGVLTFVVRAEGDPSALAAAVRYEITAADPDQAVLRVKTMDELVANSIWQQRLWGLLFGGFATTSLVLAAIGIYGVMSYAVSQRQHEIGVRLALGATAGDVLRLVLGEGLKLILLGSAIGLIGALALTRVLTSLLYGISATDPMTFAGVSLLLVAVALAASFIPARRATRVDPMASLRSE
jgi:putative ABC transport system permease protein